jgi:chorismate mutase
VSSNERDILKLFGVEGLVTLKTLVNETPREISKKKPNDAAWDIRALLDEINVRVASKDIMGCIECLNAIQRRIDYMQNVANEIRKIQGK